MTSGARIGSGRQDLGSEGPTSAHQAAPGHGSWAAQVRVVRERLVREGVAAGHDERTVADLVDRAAAGFHDARVLGYVGILVERAVREELSMPRPMAADRHPPADPQS